MTLLTDLLFGEGADPVEGVPTTIRGLLFGEDTTGPNQSAYSYNQRFNIPDVTPTQVRGSSNDMEITLLPRMQVPGGLIPNNDFITDYEGFIQLQNMRSRRVGVQIELNFTHWVGSNPAFVSKRAYRQGIGGNAHETLPLSIFNSRSNIPIGTYRTADGTEITVTAEDFANPTEIKVAFIVSIYNQSFSAKSTDDADRITLSENNASVHFWQLRGGELAPGRITNAEVNALIGSYLDNNNLDPNEVNQQLTDLDNKQTGIIAAQSVAAENVAENINRLDVLDNLTHELTVEYDVNWENDNSVQLAFTRTEPTPSNIEGLTYRSRIVPSDVLRLQYVVMRVPRSLDAGNVHNFRLHAVDDEGTERRVLLARYFTDVHFNQQYDYYAYTQIPGSGALSQTNIQTWTWTGQRDMQARRNTLFSGDLKYDNRVASEQHFPIASATPVAAANGVGSNWYARRLIFTGEHSKIIETKQGGDIEFLNFLQNHQANDITDPDQLWQNERGTYSNHFFNFRQTGLYKLRLRLEHLSPDSRGVVVRFFKWVRVVEPPGTDSKLAELAFESVSVQNLPNNVLGGAQVPGAYPQILEIEPFRIGDTGVGTIGLNADHFYFALFEKLQRVDQADVFGGRLEILRLGD